MNNQLNRIGHFIISKVPVFVPLYGGLGNQLYIFAASYAYAQRNSRKLYLIDYWYFGKQRRRAGLESFKRKADILQILPRAAFPKLNHYFQFFLYYFIRILVKFNFLGVFAHIEIESERPAQIKSRFAVFLNGLFQDPALFDDYASELRQIITQFSTDPKTDFVMCHIRLGDNLVSSNDESGVLSPLYFKSVINKYFSTCLHQILYFSDSNKIALQSYNIPTDQFDKSATLKDTFAKMLSCKHFIVGNSTLSWWAAYLGATPESIVVVPEPFYWKRFDNIISSVKYIPGGRAHKAIFSNKG